MLEASFIVKCTGNIFQGITNKNILAGVSLSDLFKTKSFTVLCQSSHRRLCEGSHGFRSSRNLSDWGKELHVQHCLLPAEYCNTADTLYQSREAKSVVNIRCLTGLSGLINSTSYKLLCKRNKFKLFK